MTKILPPLVRFLLLYYSAYLECAHFLGLTFSQISPFICYNSVDEKGGNFFGTNKVKAVTIAVFVATFMAAIEGTIVSTAMPTIVSQLDGIELMNWIFSVYLLTSAVTVPIYGKLSDLYGRKIFLFDCRQLFLLLVHHFVDLHKYGTINYFSRDPRYWSRWDFTIYYDDYRRRVSI